MTNKNLSMSDSDWKLLREMSRKYNCVITVSRQKNVPPLEVHPFVLPSFMEDVENTITMSVKKNRS